MKAIALFICLAAAAISGFAQNRVTVDQLEQRLAAEHGRSDKDVVHRLQNLQLTQRLSTARLEKLKSALPGTESRNTLIAVADLSETLGLPPSEIPPDPPPTPAEQQQMLARAVAAAETPATKSLPDFDATANITHFRNLRYVGVGPDDPACRLCVDPMMIKGENPIALLTPVPVVLSQGADGVAIRKGRNIITRQRLAWAPDETVLTGAESWDGLYTVMSNLLQDLHAAQPEWARWEQGPAGKLAVFHFSVGEAQAHFPVHTLMAPQAAREFQAARGFSGNPGYHAEVTLDPATGAVHRFLISAVLKSGQTVSRADVVAEFAPGNVDGKSFLGPLRVVTLGVSRSLLMGGYYRTAPDIRPVLHLVDVEFTDYRRGQSNAAAAGDRDFLSSAIQVTGERVTVEQLEKIVAGLVASNDRDAALRLGQLNLIQRLTAERYANMRNRLPGKMSANALLSLYDLSEFANLPQADLIAKPTPDAATQGKIVAKAVDFVANAMHKMPDLFATRQLARFEDLQVVREDLQAAREAGAKLPLSTEVKPLVMVDQSTGTAYFREGREVMEPAQKAAKARPTSSGLDTKGAFGPVLELVMTDVLNSKIGWSHWEHGPSGPLAVFRYAVPQGASHYDVHFCCYLTDDGSASSFAATPGYHGELAIDPDTGAILRLVLKADFELSAAQQTEQSRNPVLRNDVLLEYGAVDIAGKKYICPTHFVSVMTTWTLGSHGPLKTLVSKEEGLKAAKEALALMEFSRVNAINEAVFSDYHVFRSEVRIVADPGDAPATPNQQ
jgi:hypothetical protein